MKQVYGVESGELKEVHKARSAPPPAVPAALATGTFMQHASVTLSSLVCSEWVHPRRDAAQVRR